MTNHAAQLAIVLWFGRNSARPAPALTPVSLVFAVFANAPTPWPNWQAPASTRKLADHHGARGGGQAKPAVGGLGTKTAKTSETGVSARAGRALLRPNQSTMAN
jgi:hypothetical protein